MDSGLVLPQLEIFAFPFRISSDGHSFSPLWMDFSLTFSVFGWYILSNFWLFIYMQIRMTVLNKNQNTPSFGPEAEFKALPWPFSLLSFTRI